MTVRPPNGKQPKYRHQDLQIIHAEEFDPPEGRAPVIWKLITNLPVATHADAVHKLEWYALSWKIETFFRTLKTGCRIEELRLATADRLANCIALCCVVAWHLSWLTMFCREAPEASSAAVFTETERRMLELATPGKRGKNRAILIFMSERSRASKAISTALPTRRPRRRSTYRNATRHLWVTASHAEGMKCKNLLIFSETHVTTNMLAGLYLGGTPIPSAKAKLNFGRSLNDERGDRES